MFLGVILGDAVLGSFVVDNLGEFVLGADAELRGE
jgi:hypothetical protein